MTVCTKPKADTRPSRIWNGRRWEAWGYENPRHERLSYLAHGKGYVMVRYTGAMPFAISEKEWSALPVYSEFKAQQEARQAAEQTASATYDAGIHNLARALK